MELFPWKLMQFKCSVKGRPVLLETDDSWGDTMQISSFFKLSNLNKENIFQSGLISLIVGSDENGVGEQLINCHFYERK